MFLIHYTIANNNSMPFYLNTKIKKTANLDD